MQNRRPESRSGGYLFHSHYRLHKFCKQLAERSLLVEQCRQCVDSNTLLGHSVAIANSDSAVAQTLFLGGSKITADSDCSHEIKRRSLLGRKVMTNLDSILKSRDITLPTKVCLVKATVFPVVMYGCESWTIKKAEH